MSVTESEWPFAIGGTIRPAVVDVEDMEGPAIILPCPQYPKGAIVPRKRGMPTLNSETSVVNRLIRMIEELLERDDVRNGADGRWYWNKLVEIKEEIDDAEAKDIHRGGEEGEAQTGGPSSEAS